MYNQTHKILLSALAILCLSQTAAYAQEIEEDQGGKGDVAAGTFVLRNLSHATTINFSVKDANNRWRSCSLKPTVEGIFHNATGIRIVTDNGNSVEYALKYENRYEIFWNVDQRKWDVVRLVKKE